MRSFPEKVKDDIGYALYEAQKGNMPARAKPLKSLTGVIEIMANFYKDTYLTVYAVKLEEKLYVLHAFKKKSKQGIDTPKADLDLIKTRLKIAQELAKEKR